ncbi:MAG: pyridoxal-phosphate dependent enzyme [Pseudomonadota bacterium]
MQILKNPWRGGEKLVDTAPYPSVDAPRVSFLLKTCPAAAQTPFHVDTDLLGGATLWIKDERGRMGLGSFKALGAAYVIAHEAASRTSEPGRDTLQDKTYVTASAGNHGMSVAAGAQVFGAKAVVYIAATVPESFAGRLRAKGAEVRRQGADYAASMQAASEAAEENGWDLLSDSSWAGYTEPPHRLMEGYLQLIAEAVEQCPNPPTHILLQAGVGGFAGAVAAYAREAWGDEPKIAVIEPDAAPALQASIEAGASVFADGPDSIMGRLDCKEPSLIALNGLGRDADVFVTLSDAYVEGTLDRLAKAGFATTPSGGAGLAAALSPEVRAALEIGPTSRVLCFLSEAVE